MENVKYEILKSSTGLTFNIPVFLESSVDEMGVMVGFDGDITQMEEFCNFTYTQTGNTIQVYNSVHIESFRKYIDAVFTINWGDGTTSNLPSHNGGMLTSATKTYSSNGQYTITIFLESPWNKQNLKKTITIPKNTIIVNPFGTFSGFTIPYTNISGATQDYINDLDYTNVTGYTTFTYVSIGKSRIIEKKKYGVDGYTGVTSGTTSDGLIYYDYTIDNLNFRDYSDGYTMITGTTYGFTKDEVFNKMLTRNEHFLGFVDDPIIYSDIFVERGKQGVMENNLRLGEIDNVGELNVYGNGFFNIQKQ
jgi:hypothetical protein